LPPPTLLETLTLPPGRLRQVSLDFILGHAVSAAGRKIIQNCYIPNEMFRQETIQKSSYCMLGKNPCSIFFLAKIIFLYGTRLNQVPAAWGRTLDFLFPVARGHFPQKIRGFLVSKSALAPHPMWTR
jgi:hypothetical protein